MNWYRISQEEITVEMVQDPNCPPEILAEVLARKKDDYISILAARNLNTPPEALGNAVLTRMGNDRVAINAADNPNTPPETLAKALEKENYDQVSRHVAKNPNTPPETLANVILTRDGLDAVASYAASNPNCPQKALAEVLARGKVDGVSYSAITNPNCPLEAKVDWTEKVALLVIIKNKSFENNLFIKDFFEKLKDKSFLLSVLWENYKN